MRGGKLSSGIFACLLLVSGLAADGEARMVRVALPSIAISQIAVQTAQDKGFYREEGLEVELILMRGPTANVSLIAGEVEFTTVPTAGLTAAMRGAPVRIVYTTYDRPMWWMYAKPDIGSVKELKGKKLGMGGIASATGSLAKEILERNGLTAGRDVTLVAVGLQSNVLAALQGGAIDAAMFTTPWNFRAGEAGFRDLVSLTKERFAFFSGSLVTREEVLQSDPSLVKKFVRATIKGLFFVRQKRSEVISIAARNMKIEEELAAKTYDLALLAMTRDGTASKESQKRYFDLIAKLREVKDPPPFEKFFDFSVAREIGSELEAQGWKP